MNRTFSTPRRWGKDATRDETYAHFGYEVKHESGVGTGCWSNDGKTIMQNLRALPEILEQFSDPKKRIRVVFDYDPDFPRALFQFFELESPAAECSAAAISLATSSQQEEQET